MKVERVNAVIPTLDVKASLEFYQRIFEESDIFYPGDEDEYAVLILNGADSMHFAKVKEAMLPERHALMIFVDDPDAYYERCVSLSVTIDAPIRNGHGLREFYIRDNNGLLIIIAKAMEHCE